MVEGWDFSRRVELTDSFINHNQNKQNTSLCQLILLAPWPKTSNLFLSFFPHCPPGCSFRSSSSSLSLWRPITVAALSLDMANHFSSSNKFNFLKQQLFSCSFEQLLSSYMIFLSEPQNWVFKILLLMALCWSMKPHNALLIHGLLFF